MAQKPKPAKKKRIKAPLFSRLRGDFLTGLIIVAPVMLTIYLILGVVGFIDNKVLPLVPEAYNPATYTDWNIRGFGVIVFLIFTTFVGAMTKGIFGRQLVRFAEGLVDRTPIVRSIYNGLKQIAETVLNQSNSSFENACLVEYPRKGIWAIAFVSTDTKGEVAIRADQGDMLSVFLPTTPNPTSGFLLFLPKKDVIILDMDVESAAKLVISAGLVTPPTKAEIAAAKQLSGNRSKAKPKAMK